MPAPAPRPPPAPKGCCFKLSFKPLCFKAPAPCPPPAPVYVTHAKGCCK
ncbi:MAG: hypothetical protein U0800_08280 [Isosphaeraceae bacterium]